MTALVRLSGCAAPMLAPNINTDIIAPLVRTGAGGAQPAGVRPQQELAQRLFGPWRYRPDGSEQPDFILNREPFRHARFLIAGPNFACGSSRETAATMLNAFGVRCVIAPDFGQIFRDNCYRNHMLPLVLDWPLVQRLAGLAAEGAEFMLDLEASILLPPDGQAIALELSSFRLEMLLKGADEVALNLQRSDAIQAWQDRAKALRPWEWTSVGPAVSAPH